MQPQPNSTPSSNGAQVVVLGMHRSGTSVLTQLLNAMGLSAGPTEHLSPACVGNPTGYWERLDMSVLDECMLNALDPAHRHWPRYSGWLKAPFIQSLELDASARTHFDANAAAIIRELNTARPWVVKDPRLCILLPLWLPYLTRPVIVLVWRDPLEVALSLRTRDKLPLALGLMLWEDHVRSSLRVSAGLPRILVSHQAMLTDPAAVCRELATSLDALGVPDLRALSEEQLAGVVKRDLRHHRVNAAARDAILSRSQHDLLESLRRGDLVAAAGENSSDTRLVLQDYEQALQAQSVAPPPVLEHIRPEQDGAWLAQQQQVKSLEQQLQEQQVVDAVLKNGVTSLLNSQRWRWGDRFGRLAERALRRSPQPSPATLLQSVLEPPKTAPKDAPVVRSVGRPLRIIALLACHNDARFIGPCLQHLGEQGVLAYLIDHESTDGTLTIAERYRDCVLVGTETMPRDAGFSLEALRARKEKLAAELDADWFMHQDPDEIRLPPEGRGTLHDWIGEVERAAYNAVNFFEFTFVPCLESPDHDHDHYQQTMRWYYPFSSNSPNRLQAWNRQAAQPDAANLRACPEMFLSKHYLFLSPAHAERKYGAKSNLHLPSAKELRYSASDRELDAENPWSAHCLEVDPGRSR